MARKLELPTTAPPGFLYEPGFLRDERLAQTEEAVRDLAYEVERRALTAAARSWAVTLRRVFEVDPLLCSSCGGASTGPLRSAVLESRAQRAASVAGGRSSK